MISTRVLGAAGLIFAMAMVPAMAVWVPVISVPIGQAATVDVVDASRELPGRVQALSFRASDTSVMCQDVTALYRNGDQHKLWKGRLAAGRARTIYMMPMHRDVASIDLNCWALNRPGALDVTADIPGRDSDPRFTSAWDRNNRAPRRSRL